MNARKLQVGLRDGRNWTVDLADTGSFDAAVALLEDWQDGRSNTVAIHGTNGSFQIDLAAVTHMNFGT